ncbi:MAG: M28 family peptidase [Balneolaceae bacterium]
MKRLILVLAALVFTGSAFLWTTLPDIDWRLYEMSILEESSPEKLQTHLNVLAHDSLSGRETGLSGQRKAAAYLESFYQDLGLETVPGHESFRQTFHILAEQTDSLVVVLNGAPGSPLEGTTRFRLTPDSPSPWIPLFHHSGVLEGEIVFAGFGIQDPESGWTHLDGTDLQNRWVLLFDDLPGSVRDQLPNGDRWTSGYRFSELIQTHNALGVVVIGDESPEQYDVWMNHAREVIQKPRNARLASQYPNSTRSDAPKGYLKVSPDLAAQLLGLDGVQNLENLRRDLADNGHQFEPRPLGSTLRVEPHIQTRSLETENIAAWLPGSDSELNDEAIILTAHYDHIGTGYPTTTGDGIFNGADDNGSGTVALMAIARSLQQTARSGAVPHRSILFLHLSGEEMGLLGSRYYSDHPLYPIEKSIVNLNADMIGSRSTVGEKQGGEDAIYIIGADLVSADLDSLLVMANQEGPGLMLDRRFNDLQDSNQFYRRSDHWNFARLNIPFIFFFTGIHERYHDPLDHTETVDLEKLGKSTRLIHATLLHVANARTSPRMDRFLPPR